MQELDGKTAIISGAGEGIGLAIAHALGSRGMNLVIGDINGESLAVAELELSSAGYQVLAMALDVAQSNQWRALVESARDRFGNVHMLVNNAGVGGSPAPVSASTENNWRWVVDVNLMGVVNGASAVLPHLIEHGEGGWLINVASVAGFISLPMASAYSATKAAVVAMSECWSAELAEQNIHVSVLCPGFTKTRINVSERNRQARYSAGEPVEADRNAPESQAMQRVIDEGAAPKVIAERVIEALQARELYIITHPNLLPLVQGRFDAVSDAFTRAAQSPLLADITAQPLPSFE